MTLGSSVSVSHDLPVANSPAAVAAGVFCQGVEPVTREPWPASWFAVNDPADAYRCQQMWGEALRLLLIDVCKDVQAVFERQAVWDAMRTKHGLRPIIRPSWVTSADFHLVCALAGLDGEAVADRVTAKLRTAEGAAEMIAALAGPTTLRRVPNGGAGHE